MPFIDFTPGQVLTADQVDLIMRQSVMVFDDASERDTDLTDVLDEGMVVYLKSDASVLKYDGSNWVAIAPETISPFLLMGA